MDISSSVNYKMEKMSSRRESLTVVFRNALMVAPSTIGGDSRYVPVSGSISISHLRIDRLVNRQGLFVAVFPTAAEVGGERLGKSDQATAIQVVHRNPPTL